MSGDHDSACPTPGRQQATCTHCHTAALARADERKRRPEREYIVQIGRADAIELSSFSANPNGALRLGERLTVEAVEGGGLLVRTRPVGYYNRVNA